MAKKKQLAGKQTKLAKLPLTRVLAQQAEETPPWGLAPAASEPGPPPSPPPREETSRRADGPLAAAYFQVIQDLLNLQSQLPGPGGVASNPPASGSWAIPSPSSIKRVLLETREALRDLQHLLSPG
jgi:hypothetical protein